MDRRIRVVKFWNFWGPRETLEKWAIFGVCPSKNLDLAAVAGEARGGRGSCLTVLAAVFAGCHAALADERAREVALVEEAGCGRYVRH